jgi:hypothetical protein
LYWFAVADGLADAHRNQIAVAYVARHDHESNVVFIFSAHSYTLFEDSLLIFVRHQRRAVISPRVESGNRAYAD